MPARPFYTLEELDRASDELEAASALRSPSRPQWNEFFRRLTELIAIDASHSRYKYGRISDLAIEKIARRLLDERSTQRSKRPATRAAAEGRLRPILDAVERREALRSGAVALLMHSAAGLRSEPRFREMLLSWLRRMLDSGSAEDGALIGLIVMRAWGSDWPAASPHLLELLDHPSDKVRAHAAQALGDICDGLGPNSPLGDTFALIQQKEIERPGVAAPFCWGVEWPLIMLEVTGVEPPFDVKQWMFDTLTLRSGPEPHVRHFNGLVYVAARLFCADPDWIRRLMAAGQWEAALDAATDHEGSEPEMKTILLELASGTKEPFHLWEISFSLAMWHRVLLPEGAALGLVELCDDTKDADVFLITDDYSPGKPRIAIVYPKAVGGTLTEARAWRWIDWLAPPGLRGEMTSMSRDGKHASFANVVDVHFVRQRNRGPWHHIEVLANGIHEDWDLRAAAMRP